MADPLIRKVVQSIAHHGMLHAGDKVLVGVSAGPDSVVLLHVLQTLAERLDIRLGVAHLDHGLRPDAAEAEEKLVRSQAGQFNLFYHTEKLESPPQKGSIEEQLRHWRYAFFRRTALIHGYTKIALGHHADDNAEAVLMNLLRGSGVRGLSGIPPVRGNRIIRPLITSRRTEILAYAGRHGLHYMHDASNLDPRFERNRIRHQLIPLLEREFNPNLVRTLNRTAALCWEEDRWLAAHLEPLLAQVIARSDAHILELRMEALNSAPQAIQRHLIRSAIRQWQGHLRRIGADHIDALLSLLKSDRRCLHLPYHVAAETSGTLLRFQRADSRPCEKISAGKFHYTLPAMGQYPLELRIPEANIMLRCSPVDIIQAGPLQVPEQHMILLDMDRLNFPLTVRNFQPGDHFQPFGLQGRQKVKKLFIDRKISPAHRKWIPLLISANAILWVVGIRRGSEAAISSETTRVLRVVAEALCARSAGKPG